MFCAVMTRWKKEKEKILVWKGEASVMRGDKNLPTYAVQRDADKKQPEVFEIIMQTTRRRTMLTMSQ